MHFPEMVDTHFQYRNLRILRHGKHRQRHADFIIIISQGLMDPVFLREYGSNEFLGAGLPHASGDAYNLHRQLPAVKFPYPFQGFKAVLHQNAGACRLLRQPFAYYAQRAARKNLRYKPVSIHPFSFCGNKKEILSGFSGVDHHARRLGSRGLTRADQPAAACLGDVG